MMSKLRRIAALAALPFAVCGASAQKASPQQDKLISAAVVYNVARFSAWPEEGADAPSFFEVCYEAGSGMADAFATIAGKEVGGRPVRPVEIEQGAAWDARCHVYYAGARTDEAALVAATDRGSLTIGRSGNFLRRGGAVRLRIDGKPKFSVNVANAHAAGVRPSSKLLKLAEEVVR